MRKQYEEIVYRLIELILKVQVKLHRIILSGDYTWYDLNECIGPLKIIDRTNWNSRRRSNYSKCSYRKFAWGVLTVFTGRRDACLPHCMLELTYTGHRKLAILHNRIPRLQLSSVEYAIDLFCKSPNDVSRIFRLIKKHIHCNHVRETATPQKGLVKSVFRIGKSVRIYERGEDRHKDRHRKSYWDHNHLDRVRIEFTIQRQELKARGLGTLKQLINGPYFHEALMTRFGFKEFTNSRYLPKAYEIYTTTDTSGNYNCFQTELIETRRKGIKIPSQCIKDTEELTSLKDRILRKCRSADKKWARRLIRHQNYFLKLVVNMKQFPKAANKDSFPQYF